MHKADRIVLYAAAAAMMVLVVERGTGMWSPAAFAAPGAAPKAEPVAAKVATCDILAVTELLFASDAYAPSRTDEEQRLTAKLAPLETALDALQRELASADPAKPENQAKATDFQAKRDEYMQVRKESSESYDRLVAGQFAEAYERASASAASVARELGYTHVVAHKTGKVTGSDPQTLIADLLGRPVIVKPEGSEITGQVRETLKLTEVVAPKGDSPSAPEAKP